jgi:hypothetical protein
LQLVDVLQLKAVQNVSFCTLIIGQKCNTEGWTGWCKVFNKNAKGSSHLKHAMVCGAPQNIQLQNSPVPQLAVVLAAACTFTEQARGCLCKGMHQVNS